MKYTVILEREADGGYVVSVPVLPGCVSQGDTREEALANIREAIDLYVEDCRLAGDPVPLSETPTSNGCSLLGVPCLENGIRDLLVKGRIR